MRSTLLAHVLTPKITLDCSLSRTFTRFSLYLSLLLASRSVPHSCRVVCCREGTIAVEELNGGRAGDHEQDLMTTVDRNMFSIPTACSLSYSLALSLAHALWISRSLTLYHNRSLSLVRSLLLARSPALFVPCIQNRARSRLIRRCKLKNARGRSLTKRGCAAARRGGGSRSTARLLS